MSVHISDIGTDSLSRVNKILAGIPGGAFKATYSALKRAANTAKSKAGQYVSSEYSISKSAFMRNVHQKTIIQNESGDVISLNVIYAGNVIPLIEFNTKYNNNGLITTQVKRNNTPTVLEHAFAARVFGSTGIYERIGDKRFPIQQKYGPSGAHMMGNENIVENMDKTIRETYERRLEHEIIRILNGWGATDK